MNTKTKIDTLRHLAYRRGLKIVKFHPRSKRCKTDGPFALADLDTQEIVYRKQTLEDLERRLNKKRGWDFRRSKDKTPSDLFSYTVALP